LYFSSAKVPGTPHSAYAASRIRSIIRALNSRTFHPSISSATVNPQYSFVNIVNFARVISNSTQILSYDQCRSPLGGGAHGCSSSTLFRNSCLYLP
jgi:hypothetical protein